MLKNSFLILKGGIVFQLKFKIMEFNLSEEHNLLIDTTKSFVKAELLQHEELLEKTNNLPKELYDEIKKKSIKAGLYACNMPTEHGGGGLMLLI